MEWGGQPQKTQLTSRTLRCHKPKRNSEPPPINECTSDVNVIEERNVLGTILIVNLILVLVGVLPR
jgi:hypothetical protein